MLSFSRKTDYALIALAHLVGVTGVASAREIGETYRLSVPLVMKILKIMQHKGLLRSVRGVKGGYQLSVDLRSVSLYDLIEAIREVEPTEASENARLFSEAIDGTLPTEPPLLAVHSKLMRFLKDVKLSDLVIPGRRIDVPVEMVGNGKTNGNGKPNPRNMLVSVGQ